MAKQAILIQPGMIFWNVFRGALTSHGTTMRDWGRQNNIPLSSIKVAALGTSNGPKAKKTRRIMIDAVGQETFYDLYVKHLEREGLLTND